nr:cyclic nucleotide-binding protein [uncultured Gammaproteobacteria bacterium]BAL55745.1 cyclic nucleotide-binding protein [uncultured Gammaproteobacteria bacterium]
MLERFWRKSKGSEAKLKPALRLAPRPITVTELKALIPLRNLSEEELTAFALTTQTEAYGPGSVLFERGASETYVLYLLAGTVTMALDQTQSYEVTAGTAKARFPLSSSQPHNATAIAKTDVEVLKVSAKIMHKNLTSPIQEDRLLDPSRWEVSPDLKNSRLFQAFCQNFQNEELKLPTLPDIAVKLRNAIARDDLGVAEVAKIVQTDAAIAAKLMRVANSPLYLAMQPARNCLEAINRLGLKATCSLVLSLCLGSVFQSRDEFLRQKLRALWHEAIHVSALAYALAKDNRWHDPEQALLGGLLCDLGCIPFLAFAEEFPKAHYQPAEIDQALPAVRGPIGYYVLKRWGFAKELISIPLLATAWHHDSGPELALSDLILLAKLHRYLETGRTTEAPPIHSLPACRKLRDSRLSPEYSLQVLYEAKAQIQEVLNLLR